MIEISVRPGNRIITCRQRFALINSAVEVSRLCSVYAAQQQLRTTQSNAHSPSIYLTKPQIGDAFKLQFNL